MVKEAKMKQFIDRLFNEYNVEFTFHPGALKDLKCVFKKALSSLVCAPDPFTQYDDITRK